MHDDIGGGPRLLASRAVRIGELTLRQQAELLQVIGEAALDLWLHDDSWPDLVERCLEAVEEPEFPLT